MKKERYLEKPIEVLSEGDDYIGFNKPSGLLVIPSPKGEQNTLVNIVNHQYKQRGGENRLYPCHRLDRDTSGVILFAKGKSNQQKLMQTNFLFDLLITKSNEHETEVEDRQLLRSFHGTSVQSECFENTTKPSSPQV